MHNLVDPKKTRSYEETYKYYISKYSGSNYNPDNLISDRFKNIFIVLSLILVIIIIHKIYLYLKF